MRQESKVFFLRVLDLFFRRRNIILLKFVGKNLRNFDHNNSDSQNTFYENAVGAIINSKSKFARFRRIYNYREIVETVTYRQGEEYLERIASLGAPRAEDFSKFILNDALGMPTRYHYPEVGCVSPTTLRYVSVALEIKKLFGGNLVGSFAEIGVGYGGQASILKEMFQIVDYGIYDLVEVQELAQRYLAHLGKADKVTRHSLADSTNKSWDLVISNYAFSELPAALQKEYISTVLCRSTRGYLIMNSGMKNRTGRSDGKLGLDDLRKLLPDFEILEEIPNTGSDNYVIVWGHNRVAG
jgi:putative sugar O-methyltransferase